MESTATFLNQTSGVKFWHSVLRLICGGFALLAVSTAAGDVFADTTDLTPEQQALFKKYTAIAKSLKPQFGEVQITTADASLHLGNDYYFLPADQAKRVLVEAWRNSPKAVSYVLGMIFPAGKGFLDDTWAAVITYDADGYVSDSEAKKTDYDKLLRQAQDAEDSINKERKAEGLDSLHLVGWAQPPYYDQAHHSLIWARDIRFGNETDDTLNYDIRALGRRGVLSMNIVSQMSKIDSVKDAAATLQNVGTFNNGARYEDFDPGTDKTASYGIAGLVAAGIGVVAAKKLGLLAVLAVFAKKFFVIVLAAFAGIGAWIKRLFRRGEDVPPSLPPSQSG